MFTCSWDEKVFFVFLHSIVKIQNPRTKKYVKGKQPLCTIQNRENGVAVTFFPILKLTFMLLELLSFKQEMQSSKPNQNAAGLGFASF